MKKIVIIGECGLDIIYDGQQPCGSMPAGRLVNAAIMLARAGLPVAMVGDTGADALGGFVVDALSSAGVDVASIDRYTDGKTPIYFYTGDSVAAYRIPSEEGGFDIVWPRVDSGDIVVIGGFYAIDPAIHHKILAFVANAKEMKASVVYLPGYLPQLAPRLTRVMPSILENIEMASLVVTRPADLEVIYGDSGASTGFADHIGYYCPMMINVDARGGLLNGFAVGAEATSRCAGASESLLWGSAAVAAVIAAFYRGILGEGVEYTQESIKSILDEINRQITSFMPVGAPAWQLNH